MTDLTKLAPGAKPPWLINMIVEIQQGGANKYEYDPEFGLFRLDRVLHSAVHYPMAYGFIPGTLADDGDPLDILVMTSSPTFTGCLIEARPIGMFLMRDEKGEDEKVMAVPSVDPRFDSLKTLQDMRPHHLIEWSTFSISIRTWRASLSRRVAGRTSRRRMRRSSGRSSVMTRSCPKRMGFPLRWLATRAGSGFGRLEDSY